MKHPYSFFPGSGLEKKFADKELAPIAAELNGGRVGIAVRALLYQVAMTFDRGEAAL